VASWGQTKPSDSYGVHMVSSNPPTPDPLNFATVISEYQGPLLAKAKQNPAVSHEDAEDIVQDVLFRYWRRIQSGLTTDFCPQRFLYMLLNRRVIDHARRTNAARRARVRTRDANLLCIQDTTVDSPSAGLDEQELFETFEAAIVTLSDEERRAVAWSIFGPDGRGKWNVLQAESGVAAHLWRARAAKGWKKVRACIREASERELTGAQRNGKGNRNFGKAVG